MFNIFKKKLFVLIRGGLGNQLFIYTTAQNIAKENNIKKIFYINTGDILNRSDYNLKRIHNISYYIKNIKIKNDFLDNRYLNFIYIFFKYKFFNKVISENNILHSRINFLNFRITLNGFFQNKNNFKNELENTINKLYSNKLYRAKVRSNSVVISLSLYSQFGYTIPVNYYLKALKKLKIKKNEKITLTSDDEWYAKLFSSYLKKKGFNKIKINYDKNSFAFNDFLTIANSKKLIMSSSTFCWWAAVLRKKFGHDDDKVVCPKNWLSNENRKLFKFNNLKIKNNWIYL